MSDTTENGVGGLRAFGGAYFQRRYTILEDYREC